MTRRDGIIIFRYLLGGTLFMALYFIMEKPRNMVKPEDNTPTHWYGTARLDSTRNPDHYDWEKRIWIYVDEVDRAKVIKRTTEPEEIIDEYLQRKIKGYKDDTYWGEEYEFEDEE